MATKQLEEVRKTLLIKEINIASHSLISEYPPSFHNPNKLILYREYSNPPNAKHNSTLHYTRWKALNLPHNYKHQTHTKIEMLEEPFTYPTSNDPHCQIYHLNFAHNQVFIAYGSSLLAQDELQVAEHVVLGSLREYLKAQSMGDSACMPLTVQNGKPTPIVIRNVERRIAISLEANAEHLRPYGLYGNQFAHASPAAVRIATKVLEPPTLSNIIAIEAPSKGHGTYDKETILYILQTAYSGFAAAVLESRTRVAQNAKTIIHTGAWGAGAYGGNAVLMCLLQLLAARMALVDEIVYHNMDKTKTEQYHVAFDLLTSKFSKTAPLDDLVNEIVDLGLKWGESDGN